MAAKDNLYDEESDIVKEDYTGQYQHSCATADDMLFMGGRKTQSLNGIWHYAVDQYETCIRQHWYEEHYTDHEGRPAPVDFSFDEWDTMELPCSWNTVDPMYLLYESTMVFTRRFRWEKQDKQRVFLRVGAVNYKAYIFLNKKYVGLHQGGSTPFFFDVTDFLKTDNRIIIAADATRRPEQVPTENTDWFNYGGVYRDIELVSVPESYIRDFKIELVPDDTFSRIRVRMRVSGQAAGTGEASARLTIPELGIDAGIPITDGSGQLVLEARPELWSPENPRLYKVTLDYGADHVEDEVGFRQIRVVGRDILLNGKPVFLKGISFHEDSRYTGKALTQEERIQAIKDAKELGCNYMRLAHYPHNEEMAKLADREGMLLWCEIPVYWAIRFTRRATYEDAENQLRELITRDYNRASIIIWSVGNENADSDERLAFMKNLAETAHREDPTRMVSAACLVSYASMSIADRLIQYLDIIGINEYMGWYVPDFSMLIRLFDNSNPEKPVIITECGADAYPGHHGSIYDKGTEEYMAHNYEQQIETISSIPYVKGMSPWILYDFRCPRRTSSMQKYYNRKGLIGDDRKYHKMAFYVLQRFYKSF